MTKDSYILEEEVFVMERNHISTFLMVVGVIFIMVAGSIFVSTAWKYLPELVKQLCLLSAAAGLFTGSYAVAKGGRLRKTEAGLYYLGVAFTGFFALSLLGGVQTAEPGVIQPDTQWTLQQINALKMLCAVGVMLIPTVIRVVLKKKGIDFSISVALGDGMLLCMGVATECGIQVFTLILAGYILVLAGLDYYRKKHFTEKTGLDMAVSISYLVHGIVGLPFLVWANIADNNSYAIPMLQAVVVVAATGITCAGRQQTICRVINSISIFWMVYTVVNALSEILVWTDEITPVIFMAFVLNLVIMVCMMRKEMFYIQLVFGIFMTYIQHFTYLITGWHSDLNETYYPFTFALAAALIIWLAGNRKTGAYTEEAELTLKRIAMLQMVICINMWFASKHYDYLGMAFHLLVALTVLVIAELCDSSGAKAVWQTIALAAGELAVQKQPFLDIPAGYRAEWTGFLFAIGIVLLGFIWYDKKKSIRVVQFILTCCLLAVLLLNNLLGGELGNVLILGIVCVIMLLVAAVCNHKEYVIAASVTLILIALYITRSFWLNIAWWVYLFAAGVVMVGFAVKKEREAK